MRACPTGGTRPWPGASTFRGRPTASTRGWHGMCFATVSRCLLNDCALPLRELHETAPRAHGGPPGKTMHPSPGERSLPFGKKKLIPLSSAETHHVPDVISVSCQAHATQGTQQPLSLEGRHTEAPCTAVASLHAGVCRTLNSCAESFCPKLS